MKKNIKSLLLGLTLIGGLTLVGCDDNEEMATTNPEEPIKQEQPKSMEKAEPIEIEINTSLVKDFLDTRSDIRDYSYVLTVNNEEQRKDYFIGHLALRNDGIEFGTVTYDATKGYEGYKITKADCTYCSKNDHYYFNCPDMEKYINEYKQNQNNQNNNKNDLTGLSLEEMCRVIDEGVKGQIANDPNMSCNYVLPSKDNSTIIMSFNLKTIGYEDMGKTIVPDWELFKQQMIEIGNMATEKTGYPTIVRIYERSGRMVLFEARNGRQYVDHLYDNVTN